jgi:hypothetical protein
MTRSVTEYVLWVRRDEVDQLNDTLLRHRAGVDSDVDVRTKVLSGWVMAKIPAGSRDEWGTVYTEVLNVSANELPPEGRVFLIDEA